MAQSSLKFIIYICLIFGVRSDSSVDYCADDMCPYQGAHIGCNNNGDFSSDCKGQYEIIDMAPYISLILHEHNLYRNELAGGKLKCFDAATRMPVLKWNNDLAKTAEFNVKTCKFAHDPCRSTSEYPFAGQNIYYAKTSRLNITFAEFIKEAIYLWYAEYEFASPALMRKYKKTKPQTGHFTLLMNDRQTRVGCSLLNNKIFDKRFRRRVIFTCNYPSTNIRDLQSYKSGKPLADCSQADKKYKYLCADKIDPNNIYWYNE